MIGDYIPLKGVKKYDIIILSLFREEHMANLFEELWYGNICPSTDYRKKTRENEKLRLDFLVKYEALINTLNEDQKKEFEKYEEANIELTNSEEKEIFEYGFSLGAKIILELFK